jgi:hypothetical protein
MMRDSVLERMTVKQRQRALQISLGCGMLVIVILVEVLAVSPAGIYSYTTDGYRAFKINAPKPWVLDEINRVPAIRTLISCDPDSTTNLISQRHFSYTHVIAAADIWIARYRNNQVLLFFFHEDRLSRVLLLKSRFGRRIASPLFDDCQPDLLQNVDRFLADQTDHPVFYH